MTETPLKLFNSLTREIETFTPVHPGEARVYTCGPTVYNYPHIGNMRAYVFADVLGRTLSWKGYDLTHIINITDVGHLTDDGDAGEDKLEKAAAGSERTIWDIAQHYTEAFKDDVKALNIRPPAKWSVATDYIEEMIEFVKSMPEKHLYEIEGGLYFDVSTVADYGKLARAITEEGEGRIDTVEGKRNAADFAIWRKTPSGEKRQMEWDSPWGKGAPGWHLECSVMGWDLLGFPFDIHTGGIDHREIHHPNEIAQNQAFCGYKCLDEKKKSGANIWMHNNFLVERSGKMSKSSGEFLRLKLLVDRGYHQLAYRMMCLQAHYRSEMEFSWETLGAALTRLKRIVNVTEGFNYPPTGYRHPHPKIKAILDRFDSAMADDLNTSMALIALEDVVALRKIGEEVKAEAIAYMDAVLGLGLFSSAKGEGLCRQDFRIRPKSAEITEAEIEAEILRRKDAKVAKDYATADAIRASLAARGVEVMDGDPLGWEWKL